MGIRRQPSCIGDQNRPAGESPTILFEETKEFRKAHKGGPRLRFVHNTRHGKRFTGAQLNGLTDGAQRRSAANNVDDLVCCQRELQTRTLCAVARKLAPCADGCHFLRLLKHHRTAATTNAVVRTCLNQCRLPGCAPHPRQEAIEEAVCCHAIGFKIIISCKCKCARGDVSNCNNPRTHLKLARQRDLERRNAQHFKLRSIHLDVDRCQVEVAIVDRRFFHCKKLRMHAEVTRGNSRQRKQHRTVGRVPEDRVDLSRSFNHVVVGDEPKLAVVLNDKSGSGTQCRHHLRNSALVARPIDARWLQREEAHQHKCAHDHKRNGEPHQSKGTNHARGSSVGLALPRHFCSNFGVDCNIGGVTNNPRINRARLLANGERGARQRCTTSTRPTRARITMRSVCRC